MGRCRCPGGHAVGLTAKGAIPLMMAVARWEERIHCSVALAGLGWG